jgi:hypothetical protein
MAYHHRPVSNYQPCDSYFVESYEDVLHRIDPKEHAQMVARERQYAIADELSRRVSEEYQDGILSHMLDMDVRSLPGFPVTFFSFLLFFLGNRGTSLANHCLP